MLAIEFESKKESLDVNALRFISKKNRLEKGG